MESLKKCLESITNDVTNYETYRHLPEYLTAKDMIQDYANAIARLRMAMQRRSVTDLEDALAAMAYGNYYIGDLVTRGIDLLAELSRNPKKKLLSPIVKALRADDLEAVTIALDSCKRAGWTHPAIQNLIVTKIIAARKRIQEVKASDIEVDSYYDIRP